MAGIGRIGQRLAAGLAAAGLLVLVGLPGTPARLAAQTQSEPPAQLPPAAEAAPRRQRQDFLPERDLIPELDLSTPGSGPVVAETGPRFTLVDLKLDGVTAYEPEALQALYADQLGQSISLSGLYAIANAIEARYRADGYILSRALVPAQSVEDGVFRIQVIEGFVSDYRLQGRPGRAGRLIAALIAPVLAQRPVRNRDIERALLLINDLPGITARGFLRPAGAQTGAAELIVEVERQRYGAFGVADNYGSRFAGPIGFALGVQVNGLTPFGDQLALTGYTTVDFNEQRTLQLNYQQHIARALQLVLRASYSEGNPGFLLSDLDVLNRSLFAQLSLRYPWIRTRDFSLSAELGVEAVEADTDLSGGADDFTQDSLRIARAQTDLQLLDRWGGLNTLLLELRRGFRILGASSSEDPVSRPPADGSFLTVRATADRVQPLGRGFDLYLAAGGQVADGNILANEEFGVGNANFGRGYDPSETSGRNGVGATAELRYTWRPNYRFLNSVRLHSFGDYGSVWIAEGESLIQEDLASTGGGVTLTFTPWLSASGELAVRLFQDLPTREDETNRLQAYFRVVARY